MRIENVVLIEKLMQENERFSYQYKLCDVA